MPDFFRILKIEIDGHFHGGPPVRPWVAEIRGVDPKYGLQRTFLDPMTDWRDARRAWSGNVYGRVAHFALRQGRLYEVLRCKGKPSKRVAVREFLLAEKRFPGLEPLEALARVDGGGEAAEYRIPDAADGATWVARVTGLGTPTRLGWVVVKGYRHYRLRDGLYEVMRSGTKSLVCVEGLEPTTVTPEEALTWLSRNAA